MAPEPPCLVCRSRKVKCDRRKPKCSFCVKYVLPCEYSSEAPQKRGLRAGYVQRLEGRIDSLEREVEMLKSLINATATANTTTTTNMNLTESNSNNSNHAPIRPSDTSAPAPPESVPVTSTAAGSAVTTTSSPSPATAPTAPTHTPVPISHPPVSIPAPAPGPIVPANAINTTSPTSSSSTPAPSLTTQANGVPQPFTSSPPSITTSGNNFSPQSLQIQRPERISDQNFPYRVSIDAIFNSISPTRFIEEWITVYHAWFPILHIPSLRQHIEENSSIEKLLETPELIVLKAITAVTLTSPTFTTSLDLQYNPEVIFQSLRSQIVLEASTCLSLTSLQALLVVSIIDYAIGRLHDYWNLIALCKRISMQLGLRDMVAYKCENFNRLSRFPPRLLPFPKNLIDREERIRAFWLTDVLDSTSTFGTAWNIALTRPEASGSLPCNDDVFNFPEPILNIFWEENENDQGNVPSSFLLYVVLVSDELFKVHQFLQQGLDTTSSVDRVQRQQECKEIDKHLISWRNDFPVIRSPMSCYTILATGAQSFDPNLLMINATINTAIIVLYQRLVFPPTGLSHLHGPWYHALQRCLDACDDLANTANSVQPIDLSRTNPHIIACLVVAARFFIVHAKLLSVEIPPNLELIMTALEACAQHWKVAKRMITVLKTGIRDHKSSATTLPWQFYDLQYAAYDIDSSLDLWAESINQS